MAATSPVPSLSQIRAWDAEHLVDAATEWRATADQWQDSFSQVASHMPAPGGIPWEGAGSEAAQLRASTDAIKVGELAHSLRSASAVANNGADEIHAIRQSVLDAVENTESAGFSVGEDLSVTSRYTDLTPAAEMQRQAQAEMLAGDIRAKAAALVAADHEVAAKVTTAASGVRDFTLGHEPGTEAGDGTTQHEPQVLAAGWQPWKQGPTDGADSAPPSPAPRVRGLPPDGVRPPVLGTLTPGPASRPSEQRVGAQSLWDDKGGEWRYFPGDRYHNPHWDYNPHNIPKGAEWQNIPINNLPPVKGDPVPAEAPPPRPAVPVPPPAEAPPAPKPLPPVEGGTGPMIGGGPQIGPQLMPPPHSIHHLPVLGEDDTNAPWEYEE